MTISDAEGFRGLVNVPQQRRAREFVERVLATAETLLRKSGFEAFTMNTLAETAGVSIGGIYRYFPDRLSLLIAVQDRFLSRLDSDVASAAKQSKDLKSTLDAVIDCVSQAFLDNAQLLSAFLTRKEEAAIATRGAASIRNMEGVLISACRPFRDEVAHADFVEAVSFVHSLAAGLMILLADDVPGGGSAAKGRWLKRTTELKRLSLLYLTGASDP